MPAAHQGSEPSGSEVENVAGQLAEVIDQSSGDVLRAVAHALDGVIAALRAATGGTTNDGISAAVSTFARARDAAADSAHALNVATNHLTAYLHTIGFPTQTAQTNTTALTAPIGPAIPTAACTPPLPPDPDTGARRLLAELPAHTPRDKTRGLWIDDHGERHHLISGEHDEWHKAANRYVKERRLIPTGTMVITSHVEVKFAMRMHAESIRHATIAVNKTPCKGGHGCHERLAEFLPSESELTVYGPEGFRHTYYGRGR